jgi:hypothetical protein
MLLLISAFTSFMIFPLNRKGTENARTKRERIMIPVYFKNFFIETVGVLRGVK